MREYLSALIAVALLGGLVRMLAPEGNLQKYLRLTISLCLVCALVQPLLGGAMTGKDFFLDGWLDSEEYGEINYDEIYNQALQNGAKKQAEELIRTRIYQEFSLTEEMASVRTTFLSKNGTILVGDVQVIFHSTVILQDPREVVSFVNSEWDCPCTVIYE